MSRRLGNQPFDENSHVEPQTGRGKAGLTRGPTAEERGSHGLHPTTNPFLMAPKFQVRIPADISNDAMLEILEEVSEWVTHFHAYFALLPGPTAAGAVGKYHRLGDALDKTRAQVLSGTLKPSGFGDLDKKEIARLRKNFASRLSGSLTKMKHVAVYIEKNGVLNERGLVERWAVEGLLILLSSIQSAIREMVSVRIWEERMDTGPRLNMREAVQRMILDAERNAERDTFDTDGGGDAGPAVRGVE